MSDDDADRIARRVAEQLRSVPVDRPLYKAETLAERLAISPRKVREMLADGSIPSIKIDGARRVEPHVVDELIERLRAEG